MGKSAGSAPAAPDPAATAAAQGQANKDAVYESARVNQINQVTPYGTVNFTGEIGSPDRTQTIELNPTAQAIFSGQQGVAKGLTDFAQQYVPRVAEGLSTPFSTANIGAARPTVNADARSRFEQDYLSRLDPQVARDRSALENRLANQGIGLGTEAYSNAMDDFGRSVNDLRLASLQSAGNAYAQQYGLESQSYNQALSDALLNRTQGLNEVSALLQGAPAIQTPQANPVSQYQIAAPDYMGASALQYQGALNSYNQQQQNSRSMMGGLSSLGGSLGAAAILASDRRVKKDIKRVGAMDNGLPVYTFRYKSGGPVQMGVMAQEVEKVRPEAVHAVSGVLHVDYGAL